MEKFECANSVFPEDKFSRLFLIELLFCVLFCILLPSLLSSGFSLVHDYTWHCIRFTFICIPPPPTNLDYFIFLCSAVWLKGQLHHILPSKSLLLIAGLDAHGCHTTPSGSILPDIPTYRHSSREENTAKHIQSH